MVRPSALNGDLSADSKLVRRGHEVGRVVRDVVDPLDEMTETPIVA